MARLRVFSLITKCPHDPDSISATIIKSFADFSVEKIDSSSDILDFMIAWAMALQDESRLLIPAVSLSWKGNFWKDRDSRFAHEGILVGCLCVINDYSGSHADDARSVEDDAFLEFLHSFTCGLANLAPDVEWTSNMSGRYDSQFSRFMQGISIGATSRLKNRWRGIRKLLKDFQEISSLPRTHVHKQEKSLYLKIVQDLSAKFILGASPYDRAAIAGGIEEPTEFNQSKQNQQLLGVQMEG